MPRKFFLVRKIQGDIFFLSLDLEHVDQLFDHGDNIDFISVQVEAPGFKFSIESRPASKFPEKADQIKYGHLNLKFDEGALPKLAKGFLAQLAGVREMTERRRSSYSVTKSLPARPSSTASLADFESDAHWVRRTLDDLF